MYGSNTTKIKSHIISRLTRASYKCENNLFLLIQGRWRHVWPTTSSLRGHTWLSSLHSPRSSELAFTLWSSFHLVFTLLGLKNAGNRAPDRDRNVSKNESHLVLKTNTVPWSGCGVIPRLVTAANPERCIKSGHQLSSLRFKRTSLHSQ